MSTVTKDTATYAVLTVTGHPGTVTTTWHADYDAADAYATGLTAGNVLPGNMVPNGADRGITVRAVNRLTRDGWEYSRSYDHHGARYAVALAHPSRLY